MDGTLLPHEKHHTISFNKNKQCCCIKIENKVNLTVPGDSPAKTPIKQAMKTFLLTSIVCLTIFAFNGFGQTRTKKTADVRPLVAVETVPQKIDRIARAHRLDPRLFNSLIYAESTFKQNARSYKGAGCLTQLMPATARRFGLVVNAQVDERFSNIDKCLSAGANYLSWLLSTFKGDVRLALAGYNAGEGAVFKFGGRVPPYKETVQYVEKICALYYGQSGHGVAMAYNQPLAQGWANALYRTWRPARTNLASIRAPVQRNSAADHETVSVQDTKVKKTGVTRVKIDEAAPKLKTESLIFW